MSTTASALYPDAISGSWLAARLAIEPAQIEAERRAGELIAVRRPGTTEWLYPAWQFESWKPRRGVERVVRAAREAGLGEARLYELLTAPLGLRGNASRRTLVDLLHEGRVDEVISSVRAAR